jgi:hypothetical protein
MGDLPDWVEDLLQNEMSRIRPAVQDALDNAYRVGYLDGWHAADSYDPGVAHRAIPEATDE